MNTSFTTDSEHMGTLHTWSCKLERECPDTSKFWSVDLTAGAYWRVFEVGIRFAPLLGFTEFTLHLGPFFVNVLIKPFSDEG